MEFEGQQELIDRIEQCTNLLEIWRVLKFNRMFGLVIAELDIDDYNVKSIEYRGVDITDSIVRAIETDKGINSVFESIDRKELKKSMSIIKGGQC
jgi:hypothetical protein